MKKKNIKFTKMWSFVEMTTSSHSFIEQNNKKLK